MQYIWNDMNEFEKIVYRVISIVEIKCTCNVAVKIIVNCDNNSKLHTFIIQYYY